MILVTRDEWGALPPKSVKPISSSEGIFVHYTVTPTGPDEASIVRGVQNFHMDTRDWQDIAYSFLVGQSGNVYEGRGWGVAGGHTEGWNSRSHAVCWIGNEEQPSDAALVAINEVIAEHDRRYGGFVRPHNAVNQTSCPGPVLTPWIAAGRPTTQEPDDMPITPTEIDAIAGRVRDFLASPATNPGTVIDPGARQALANIETGLLDPVAGVRTMIGQLTPTQIADAVPADIARAVADELAERLKA